MIPVGQKVSDFIDANFERMMQIAEEHEWVEEQISQYGMDITLLEKLYPRRIYLLSLEQQWLQNNFAEMLFAELPLGHFLSVSEKCYKPAVPQ